MLYNCQHHQLLSFFLVLLADLVNRTAGLNVSPSELFLNLALMELTFVDLFLGHRIMNLQLLLGLASSLSSSSSPVRIQLFLTMFLKFDRLDLHQLSSSPHPQVCSSIFTSCTSYSELPADCVLLSSPVFLLSAGIHSIEPLLIHVQSYTSATSSFSR